MQPPQRITSASDMSSPFSNCNPRNCCLALPVIQFLKRHQTECKFCPVKLIAINYTNNAVRIINYQVNFDKKNITQPQLSLLSLFIVSYLTIYAQSLNSAIMECITTSIYGIYIKTSLQDLLFQLFLLFPAYSVA